MSAEVEEGRKSDAKGRCARLFWRLFPHVFLILSLMLYALLGALIFKQIENRNLYNESERIDALVRKVVETVQNHSDTSTQLHREIENILNKFHDEKKQEWNFYSSLFFCCTVFTTLGYGRMYPVTHEGKVACILYAMVGIPLMLLVISDVGDILAVLLSKAYTRLSLFFSRCMVHRSWSLQRHEKASHPQQVQGADTDAAYMFNHVVVHKTMNIQQVIRTQSSFRRTSLQLRNNKDIIDRIIVKESFRLKGSQTKSFSCPDLDRIPSPNDSSKLFTGIGEKMERINVPILVILLVVFAYMVVCSHILRCWETQMEHFDAFYFTFITLTTIGFGDIVPEHPKYFMVTFLFIIMGMAIMSMAFKLGQSQITSCYRQCIKCLSMGRIGIHKDLDSN